MHGAVAVRLTHGVEAEALIHGVAAAAVAVVSAAEPAERDASNAEKKVICPANVQKAVAEAEDRGHALNVVRRDTCHANVRLVGLVAEAADHAPVSSADRRVT